MHSIPRHRHLDSNRPRPAGALNFKSLWQHQKSAVCVANDLGLLTLVPPMVISNQGAEQGIKPILRFLGIGGSEQFLAHDSGEAIRGTGTEDSCLRVTDSGETPAGVLPPCLACI